MITVEPTYIPPTVANFPFIKLMLSARNGGAAGGTGPWNDPERGISVTPSVANIVANNGKYIEFGSSTVFATTGLPDLTGKYPVLLLQGRANAGTLVVTLGDIVGAGAFCRTGFGPTAPGTGPKFGSGQTNYVSQEAVGGTGADSPGAMIVADIGGGVVEQWYCTGAGGIAVKKTPVVTGGPIVWGQMDQQFILTTGATSRWYGTIMLGAFSTPPTSALLQKMVQFAKNNPGIVPNMCYGMT